jgi:hypothetical protein
VDYPIEAFLTGRRLEDGEAYRQGLESRRHVVWDLWDDGKDHHVGIDKRVVIYSRGSPGIAPARLVTSP